MFQGYCRNCGYDLRGLESRRCPECGRAFDPDVPRTFSATPPLPALRRWARRIALLLLAAALLLAVRIGYSFTNDGQVDRLLRQARGEKPSLFDSMLVRLDLLPPPASTATQLFFHIGAIRSLTADECASLLNSPDADVRAFAIEALVKKSDPRAIRPVTKEAAYSGAYWATHDVGLLLEKCGPAAFEPLLDDADPKVRMTAELELARAGNQRAVERLIAQLPPEPDPMRVWRRKLASGEWTEAQLKDAIDRHSAIVQALRSLNSPEVDRIFRQRSAQAEVEAEAERRESDRRAREILLGPDSRWWPLYTHLMPQKPDSGPYLSLSKEGSPVYAVPASVTPQRSASRDEIRQKFGPPDQVVPSATWPSPAGPPATGEVWRYGDELEILFDSAGRAELLKTERLDRRVLGF